MQKSKEKLTSWNVHGYQDVAPAASKWNGLLTVAKREKIS